jgi:Zn-dependent protease with chaperone function
MPASGVPGHAYFESVVLVLHGQGHWYTAPSGDIQLRLGGFDGRQWMIVWESPIGLFTAILTDEAAVKQFIAQAPEAVAKRLRLVHKIHARTGRRFSLAMFLGVALLFLPLFSLVWFWLNAASFSQWAANQVSVEREIRLGEMAFQQMATKLKLLPEGAPLDDVVDRIGVRLTAGSAYPFHFHVVQGPEVNAFALPGGHVVVFTGLLKAADTADEVAGVLAHEASHVEKRHVLRNLIHGLGLRAVVAVALGDLSGGVWDDMVSELVELSYSRDMELEADLEGLRLLRKSGLSAEGLASFFEKLADQEEPDIELLSSHPVSDQRLSALRKAMVEQGPYLNQPLDVDWDKVKAAIDSGS